MSTGEHTPGPWTARGTAVVAQVNGHPWEVCNNGDVGPSHPILGECLANARLIAAAPDLLAAAAQALADFDRWGDVWQVNSADVYEAAEKIRAAVALATGERVTL